MSNKKYKDSEASGGTKPANPTKRMDNTDKETRETQNELIRTLEGLSTMVSSHVSTNSVQAVNQLRQRKRHSLNPRKPFPYNQQQQSRLPSLTTANQIRHDPRLVQARGCTTCGRRLWDPL